MGIKAILYGLVLFSFGWRLTSCIRNCGNGKATLKTGSVLFSPEKDSVAVGDTLWLSSSIPYKLENAAFSDTTVYDLSNASGVITECNITSLISENVHYGAVDSFDYVSSAGSFETPTSSPDARKLIVYAAGNGKYQFEMGLIAKRAGIYSVTLLDIFQAEKKCFKASIMLANNNNDQHLHYMKDIYFGGGVVDETDARLSYCFKVY